MVKRWKKGVILDLQETFLFWKPLKKSENETKLEYLPWNCKMSINEREIDLFDDKPTRPRDVTGIS